MKNSNLIDLTGYFVQTEAAAKNNSSQIAGKIIHVAGRALDVAATAVITLCVCACTLLFFTML